MQISTVFKNMSYGAIIYILLLFQNIKTSPKDNIK